MIDAIKEAIVLLRDPHGRDPESMQKVATGLEELIAGADVIVGLSAEEAISTARCSNLWHDTLVVELRPELEQMKRDHQVPDRIAPLARAAMKLETALLAEGIKT